MNKYRNQKTTIHGKTFSSKRESQRYCELLLLERSGAICELKLQVVYILAPSVVIHGRKRPAMKYICDFVYVQDGKEVCEDVKGMRTAVYICKRHLMKSVHGVEIKET